jgi:hypothetical protein
MELIEETNNMQILFGATEKVHPTASLLSSHGAYRRDQQHADLVWSY